MVQNVVHSLVHHSMVVDDILQTLAIGIALCIQQSPIIKVKSAKHTQANQDNMLIQTNYLLHCRHPSYLLYYQKLKNKSSKKI